MTDDHLSLDELAELDEGLLSPERISAMRAHLHDCAQCSAQAAEITNARSALAALPSLTMPTDVRARIDAALAAEAAGPAIEPPVLRAVDSVPEPTADEPEPANASMVGSAARSAEVMPAPGSVVRPRFGRPTAASSAVAAAFVLAIGAIVVAHFIHHDSTTPSNTSTVSAGGDNGQAATTNQVYPSSFSKTSSGDHYTVANLDKRVKSVLKRGTSAPPSTTSSDAITGSPLASPSATGVVPSPASSGSSNGVNTPATASGGGKSSRKSIAPENATGSSGAKLAISSAPVPKVLRPLFRSKAKIINCAVALVGDANAVPLQVDFARWSNDTLHNAPSPVFIFDGATAGTVSVYVTNPTCSGNDLIRSFKVVSIS